MSTDGTETTTSPKTTQAPKRITNAQTVCSEKNEKGKPCNGHLKQLRTMGQPAEVHLRGDDVLSQCQTCGTLYMGPPLGHVHDPKKQSRFVEAELATLLQAAGGTLPVIEKNDKGVYILIESGGEHEHSQPASGAKPLAATPAATTVQASTIAGEALAPPKAGSK